MIKKDDYNSIVHPLERVFDEHSKILIPGSFPSVITREYGSQNSFWKVLGLGEIFYI